MAEPVIRVSSITTRHMGWRDIWWARNVRNNPLTRHFLGDHSLIGRWQQIRWFNRMNRDKSKARLIVLWNDIRVGIARIDSIDHQNQSLCIGMDIDPKWRGFGLAQAAYKALFIHFFKTFKYHRLWLLVASDNDRAIHIYQKLGFTTEGTQKEAILKNGKWIDYHYMALLKQDYEKLYPQY